MNNLFAYSKNYLLFLCFCIDFRYDNLKLYSGMEVA